MLTHGSLFAGIGGFDLGFERAGIKTVWQVEIDPFCRKVLEKNFPHVQRFSDIETVCRKGCNFRSCWLDTVDIISGGFPCQDISGAGLRAGIDGERSGLWGEMLRIICELRPRFVVVENVADLLSRGIDRVLGQLAESGFDAEWQVLPAAAFGAPHLRKRIWIVAYPESMRMESQRISTEGQVPLVDPDWRRPTVAYAHGQSPIWTTESWPQCDSWDTEPALGRVVDGIPVKLVQPELAALGNSIVPQIAEWIGKRIIEAVAGESGRNPVESLSENEADR